MNELFLLKQKKLHPLGQGPLQMMDYRQQKVKLKKPTGDWQLGMLIRICVPWKGSSFLRDEKSVRFLVDFFFFFTSSVLIGGLTHTLHRI